MSQPVLPLLPSEARSIGPSAGLLEGPDGGVVFVFGMATFGYGAGDGAGRRLAAVQLVTTKIASATEVALAFGISQATLCRWAGAFSAEGVVALVRERPGPRGPSKLTAALSARIVALHTAGMTLRAIASKCEVSTATVRVALGRVGSRKAPTHKEGPDLTPTDDVDTGDVDTGDVDTGEADAGAQLVVLASPVARTDERVAARFGDLVEAPVVITQGAQLPLAGLLLALPALEMTGLLGVAEQVFPPMRKGFYGLRATLLMGVFMALLREPRAEGCDPDPPG